MRPHPKESAKVLKALLRQHFPATAFSCRLGRGTGWGSLDVSWTDGPTVAAVDGIVRPFEGKGFDGRDDSTYYKDARHPDGTPSGIGYLSLQRTISADLARRCAEQVAAFYGITPPTVIPSACGYQTVPEDLPISNMIERWDTMIYRAASDRTRYARTMAP